MGIFGKIIREIKTLGEERRYYCNICKKTIIEGEYDYSMNKFKKALCRYHQNRYNSSKKSRPEAKKLCCALRKRGITAKLEQSDGYKHIDIAIPSIRLNIEVDGMQHAYSSKQALADMKRDYHSERKGFVTLRIKNSAIRNNFPETLKYILKRINLRHKQIRYDERY